VLALQQPPALVGQHFGGRARQDHSALVAPFRVPDGVAVDGPTDHDVSALHIIPSQGEELAAAKSSPGQNADGAGEVGWDAGATKGSELVGGAELVIQRGLLLKCDKEPTQLRR
jgi:hypothetical protein